MLDTDPTKAVAEVAHELMHAAHAGLIWPDEPFIASALQSEVRGGARMFPQVFQIQTIIETATNAPHRASLTDAVWYAV